MTNEEITKIELLKEILKWQKIIGRDLLEKKSKNLFSNDKEISVFKLTNGKRSSREIGKLTDVNYKKVQALWKGWIREGVAEPSDKYGGGRCVKIFEISDFGIEK